MISHARTCVGCRRRGERDALVRLAVVAGEVVPDVGRTLPGRGASLHPGPHCLALALKRRALTRAFPGATVDPRRLEANAVFQAAADLGE